MNDMEENIINSEKAIRFLDWFQKSYKKLKSRIIHSPSDEDAFHDTFLTLYRKIVNQEDLKEYEPYFLGTYYKIRLKQQIAAGKYVFPEEYFFQNLPLADNPDEKLNDIYPEITLSADIMSYVKSKFTAEEYELFYLHTMENGFAPKELSYYTGLPIGYIYRRLAVIKKNIFNNLNFASRWKRCQLQTF